MERLLVSLATFCKAAWCSGKQDRAETTRQIQKGPVHQVHHLTKCLTSQSHTRPSSQTFLKKILRLFKLLLSPVAASIQQAVSAQSTGGMGLRLNIRPVRICTALSCHWDPSFSASTGGASDIRRSSLAGANNAWSLETAQRYASKYASSILDILHGLGAWSKIPRRYAPGLMRQLSYAGSALPSLNNLLRLFALKAPASLGCSCWTLQGLKQTLRVNDHFGSERMEVWKFIFYHIFQNCVPWEVWLMCFQHNNLEESGCDQKHARTLLGWWSRLCWHSGMEGQQSCLWHHSCSMSHHITPASSSF